MTSKERLDIARMLIRTTDCNFINWTIKFSIDDKLYNIFVLEDPATDFIQTWDLIQDSAYSMSSTLSQSDSPLRENNTRDRAILSPENSLNTVILGGYYLQDQFMDDDVAREIIDDVEHRYGEGLAIIQ